MNLEKLGKDEIENFINKLNDGKDFSKYQFYNMAYDENKRIQKKQELKNKFGRDNVSDITLVNEEISVIKYGHEPHDKIYYMACINNNLVRDITTHTFDEALLLALMSKYNASKGFIFVAKALGMEIGRE